MKYQGCLLAVKDISASKHFYEKVLCQNVIMDIGEHVAFEVENLDEVYAELKNISGLKWVHEIKEYPWGQRDIRVYDPDMHIVEIAEDMGVVIKRFLGMGMSKEEVAARTMFPLEVVEQYI